MTIPKPSHAVVDGKPIDRVWYAFLQGLSTSSLTAAQVQAIVDAAVAALPESELRILQTSSTQVTGNAKDGYAISLRTLEDSGIGALLGITRDGYGRITGTTNATITGTAGQIDVANGDAVAGPPTLSLADVADSGTGTLQKTAFDAKGRRTGTAAATTDDLGEGAANLYYTDARADVRVAAGVSAHEAAADPHPQYTTAAEAAAAAPVQSVNTQTGAVTLTAADVGADPSGTAAGAVTAHEAAANPHPQYALDASITGPVPTRIAAGQTYTVPADTQVLWTLPIELEADASIEALGDLVQVN